MIKESGTIYHGIIGRKTICADTEAELIQYLEENGGGVYHNVLHRLKITIPAAPKESK